MNSTSSVRGHQALNRPAPLNIRIFAGFADLGLAGALLFFILGAIHASPSPKIWWWVAWGAGAAALWAIQVLIFGKSLGEHSWGLESKLTTQPLQLLERRLMESEVRSISSLGL